MPPSAPPPPGRIGPYDVLDVLGQGGMGTVYRVRHRELGAVRALKVLDVPASGRWVRRFEREARHLAAVRHPNVVTIHEAGGDEELVWLSMDLVEGEPLTQVLARGPLPVERALEVAIGIGRGLAVLHDAGIAHRDLKPANVLLTPDGVPVILDLGLAFVPEEDTRLTDTGAVMGTLHYMAPEQVTGERAAQGPATDVHALGLVLHELLTGRGAFDHIPDHAPAAALMAAVVHGPRPRPGAIDRSLPAALDRVVARATARDPRRRHATAAELVAALEAVRGDPGPSGRTVRRRRAAVAGACLALAAGVAAALGPVPSAPAGVGRVDPPPSPAGTTTPSPSPAAPEAPDPSDAAAEALRLVEAREDPRQRLAQAAAWLERHPDHPSRERALELWAEARAQVPLAIRGGHTAGMPLRLTFSGPRQLVSAGFDGRLRVWRASGAGLEALRGWDLAGRVDAVAPAVDEASVYLSSRAALLEVDLADGSTRRRWDLPGLVDAVELAPNGATLALVLQRPESDELRLLELPSGRTRWASTRPLGAFRCLAVSADGRFVAAGRGAMLRGEPITPAVAVWQLADGRLLGFRELLTDPLDLAFVADDLLAVGTSAGRLSLLDPITGIEQARLEGRGLPSAAEGLGILPRAHAGATDRLAATPTRLYTASASEDVARSEVRTWDLTTWSEAEPARHHEGRAGALAVSPDGRFLVVGCPQEGQLVLYDLRPEWHEP